MTVIVSPRPPLNIFDVSRIPVQSFFTTILETPSYQIPASGPNPQRDVGAVALLTSLIVANNGNDTMQLSMRVIDANDDQFLLLNQLPIPANDFALIDLAKQNLPSGEQLQLKVEEQQGGVASLSYIINQREEFEVIV